MEKVKQQIGPTHSLVAIVKLSLNSFIKQQTSLALKINHLHHSQFQFIHPQVYSQNVQEPLTLVVVIKLYAVVLPQKDKLMIQK